MLNSHENTKGRDIWPNACDTGLARFDAIEHVNWIQFAASVTIYDVGHSITAEKGTGNFNDDVLGNVVMRHGCLELNKERKTEYAEESVGETI